ncbi:MAG: hypothetical protein IJG63_00350 [Oscillospiraceae bacterium]|nr:hypothetical protein [Oscillospiraceae bacterium]
MKIFRRITVLLTAICLMLSLSGCFTQPVYDLYSLPELSDEYVNLREEVSKILSSGATFSAPGSGMYRTAVQMEDLDGDGQSEAIAFFNFTGEDCPLKVYIYRFEDDHYAPACVIEGEGSGFDKISYTDLDGDGISEIAVGWKLSTGISLLTVHSIKDFKPVCLLSTDYSEYAMAKIRDDSHLPGLLVLRLSSTEQSGKAEYYTLTQNGEMVSTAAALSKGVESVSRVRSGLLDGGIGVYVESWINGGSTVTDILTVSRGQLTNITLNPEMGVSIGTLRSSGIYSYDLNNDGILEVPVPVQLPGKSEAARYSVTEWYRFKHNGGRTLVMRTFHNYSDGWYLELPDDWTGNISVRRDDTVSGQRSVIFSLWSGGGVKCDFLTISALTGSNRMDLAESDGRFLLDTDEGTAYAAHITAGPSGLPFALSKELITDSFRIIYKEWNPGEV